MSHRAVLERERQAKKAERLASISIGEMLEGTVRKILDFGAFVDLGGLDGLIHISQLSWEKVKHPSEVLKEGDKVKVRIEKIDAETGKIGLSYRSMQDHPWNDIDARFPVGAVVKGTVSRIAAFGVFVKIAPGIEGLVHVSEIAYRRVSTPSSVVQGGQEVEVKVLSVDREAQRISLSIKQAQAAPVTEPETKEEEVEEPVRKPAVSKHQGPLKGGVGSGSSGEQFGLKW
jgi:small subunit ribosomal protein S1